MKLTLHFRAVVAGFSASLAAEFDQLLARINSWSGKQHNVDGTHADITATGVVVDGDISMTSLTFGGTTQTTVGAAGGASALPATPTGYLTITIGTTNYVVPYYGAS